MGAIGLYLCEADEMKLPKELEDGMRNLITMISPATKSTRENIILWGSSFGALWFLLIVLKMSQHSRPSWTTRLCLANIVGIVLNVLAIKFSKNLNQFVSYTTLSYPILLLCVVDVAVFLLYFVLLVVRTLNGIIWMFIVILVKLVFYVGMIWVSLVYGYMIYDSLSK